MKRNILIAIMMMAACLSFVGAASWPSDTTGTNIGASLPAYYEPSGLVYHEGRNTLFTVSDEGVVSELKIDGTVVKNWYFSGDFEGITVADINSNYVYIVTEYPFTLSQLDLTTGTITKTWSLTNLIPATSVTNLGLEAVTFVPNGLDAYPSSTSGGHFYFGVQETGAVYVVDVDLSTANKASLVGSFTPVQARTGISDMYYAKETGTIYTLYRSVLTEIKASDHSIIAEYSSVPGINQEGIAVIPSCPAAKTSIVIGEDRGGANLVPSIVKYNNYPLSCPVLDTDGDGLTDTQEASYGTNPSLPDTDSDTLTDGQEVLTYLTNPLLADTDGGSISDGVEVQRGTNPLLASDDVVVVVDVNLIASIVVNSDRSITVSYKDGHSNSFTPFSSGVKPKADGNYDNTRVIATDGKYIAVFKNGVEVTRLQVNRVARSSYSFTVNHKSAEDEIIITFSTTNYIWTDTVNLKNDVLKLTSVTKTQK